MNPILYGFSPGEVVKTTDSRSVIEFFPPHRTKRVQTRDNDNPHGLTKGTRVICSWLKESPRDNYPQLLEHEAIEPEDLWYRPESYQPRFPHTRTKGFKAECWIRDRMRKAGIRTEHATFFEDECLGVDLWVLLKLTDTWRWYGIDVTLLKLDSYKARHKRKLSRERGVLPIEIHKDLKKCPLQEMALYMIETIQNTITLFANISLIERSDAFRLEKERPSRISRAMA